MAVKKVVLEVVGEQTIHCAGCEATIRRGLGQLPGVLRVEPSRRTQRVQVTLDTAQTSLEALQKHLAWMGWDNRPAGGETDG